ncbi:META domain-containing protein [Roseomonas sp. CAU 1739]|uniref:META domain-containing protein n=1 Tax=Roseomonas sp. CAU 1739 TaxID=3140364 RepID=UPI00325AAEE2
MLKLGKAALVAAAVVVSPVLAKAGTIRGIGWNIVEVDGRPMAADVGAWLRLQGSTVSGRGACNTFRGTVIGDPDTQALRLSVDVTTRMACWDQESEAAIFVALAAVRSWRPDQSGAVLLLDDGGTPIMRLAPRPPAER